MSAAAMKQIQNLYIVFDLLGFLLDDTEQNLRTSLRRRLSVHFDTPSAFGIYDLIGRSALDLGNFDLRHFSHLPF